MCSACFGGAEASAPALREIPTPVVAPTLEPLATPSVPPTAPTETVVPSPTPRPGREWAHVLRVWDGNTILIDGGLSVRYIGVDTPGGGMFNRPLEPFGRQAAERNLALVEGKDIEIEQDVNDVDGNGFLLRYVYVGGAMVNQVLLREGLAKMPPASADRKYQVALEAAQEVARSTPLNIWTLISPTPRPTSTPTPIPTPATATPSTPSPTVQTTGTPPTRTVTPLVTATPTGNFGTTPTRTLTPVRTPTPG